MLLAGLTVFSGDVLRSSRRSNQRNAIPVTPGAPHGCQEAPPVFRMQLRCVVWPNRAPELLQSSGERSGVFQAMSSAADRRPASVGAGSASSARQRAPSPPVPAVASSGSSLLQCSSPLATTVHLFSHLYSFASRYCMFSPSSIIFAFQSFPHLICFVFNLKPC